MRVLWYSNAPWAPTGYGQQTALWVPKLQAAGHDVAVAAFHGLQGVPISWGGMTVYPGSQEDQWAQDVMLGNYQQHKADLMITLMDAWVLDPGNLSAMQEAGARIVHWQPVDCEPLSILDHRVLAQGGARTIAISRHGERQLAEFAPLYVPHGIDTKLFTPLDDEFVASARGRGGYVGKFVIGINSANQDPVRKGFGEQLAAFRLLADRHPDVRLLIHGRQVSRTGTNLNKIVERLHLQEFVTFGDQYRTVTGLTTQAELAKWYSILDLFSCCSYGEGFGIPIIEAQAAGTPVVVTDASAMTELAGPGWLAGGEWYWNAGHNAWWTRPSIQTILAAYEQAYQERGTPEAAARRQASREFALQYDADHVMSEYWMPVLAELSSGTGTPFLPDPPGAEFTAEEEADTQARITARRADPPAWHHPRERPQGLSDVVVMTTAWKRPYYLEETLAAWERVRGLDGIRKFCVCLGASEKLAEAREVIEAFAERVSVPVEIWEDNGTLGPWRTLAQGGNRVFGDPGAGFIVVAEEDILPAEDMLEYLAWGRDEFADDPAVLVVNAHSRCGQGWDGPNVKDDPDADPALVRLLPYFNQWGWGTWRDRWENVLIPDWDYDGTSGHRMQSGHDWNIHLRTMRGYVAATPDASRTQHIGDLEAWAATADTLSWSKAESFREHREPVTFEVAK